MSRRQSPECVSDLQLERWLVGELSKGEVEAASAHVAECALCRSRREALEHEHRTLARQFPPFASLGAAPNNGAARKVERAGINRGAQSLRLAGPRESRVPSQRACSGSAPSQAGAPGAAQLPASMPSTRLPRRSRVQQRVWAALGSLAAGLVLWVVASGPGSPEGVSSQAPPSQSPTRTKGDAIVQLEWIVRRGSTVLSPSPSEALQPGDALRFRVRTSRPGHAAVLSLDGERKTSVYHDWVPVTAGVQLLPGAVELDDVLGNERLYGVVCEGKTPLAAVEAAVRREPVKPELPSDCALDLHVLRKERP